LIKDAKNPSDFEEAAKEFGRAVRAAPWWADGYINEGVALEKAGKFSDAIRSLKFYLLAAPAAPDADKIKDQIYALEVRQEKAAQEKAAKDAVAQRQREEQLREQRWLDSINGARFTVQLGPWPKSSMRFIRTIDIKGREVIFGEIAYYGSDVQYNVPSGTWMEDGRATLRGREFDRPGKEVGRGTISEDGNSVVIQWSSGSSFTYRRQR
jgi:tetratricopeptide (TPR) repeat protein